MSSEVTTIKELRCYSKKCCFNITKDLHFWVW